MKSHSITLWILCMLLLQACSSRTIETVIVDNQPDTPSAPEIMEAADQESIDNVLRIGEVNNITGFDPLFALNPASQRAIQLIYEGLVTLDEQDDIKPAIAKRWQISSDSLQYTFYLDKSTYYHDDESFNSGIGRRVRASDFKQAFERMASRDVPPNAAELFVDHISGFEAYFYEQREVYQPEERTLDQIDGIQANNDSTLTFTLIERDPDFLYKLASPFAVVYPQEALRRRTNGLKDHPVGTGPFSFGASSGDTLYILNRNTDYRITDENEVLQKPKRVEILNLEDEARIFRQFALGRLNVIMELGPQMIQTLVNSDNELEISYREQYELGVIDHKESYIVRYNPNNKHGLDSRHASTLANILPFDSLKANLGNPSLQLIYQADGQDDESSLDDLKQRFTQGREGQSLILAFGSDLSAQLLSAQIINQYKKDFKAVLMDQRVFSRNIFLYLDQQTRYTPHHQTETLPQEILRFDKDRYYLINNNIDGIGFNSYSWWLNLNDARVSENVSLSNHVN
ncbi:MAG: ABC transporter substrate-binding protein [Balneolales bacterium]